VWSACPFGLKATRVAHLPARGIVAKGVGANMVKFDRFGFIP
jgi:hypothetical protein